MGCLDEKTLSSYLDERLSESERQIIEAHIAQCNHCLDMLVVAHESRRFSTGLAKRVLKSARTVLKRTVLALPHILRAEFRTQSGSGVEKIQRKKTPELKWLLGAIFSFALSFIIKRYFLQFLVAAAILGFKWAMEGEGARRVIMIFKDMQKKEKDFERRSRASVYDKKHRS